MGVGPVPTKASDGGVDQPRVDHPKIVVPQPETIQHTGLLGLDHDVGLTCQIAHDVAVSVLVQVELDTALPAPPERVRSRMTDAGATGRFDLDHVRAEVGEQLADLSTDPIR
ncbi:unannotated protein [freshwater metagenome]|uniref:Unannotated protein n=1 Tax=freshwater metagenome TaxID=449393 RepID=A0A6J7CAB1_9ZZZZ